MRRLLNILFAVATVSVLGFSSCAPKETPAAVEIPSGNEYKSAAFSTEQITIDVTANYDWTYTLTDEFSVFSVERKENQLIVTPGINYSNKQRIATISIKAGGGANIAEQAVRLVKEPNEDTFLTFESADFQGDAPVINIEAGRPENPVEYVVNIFTNNLLTIVDPSTKAIDINEWLNYEFIPNPDINQPSVLKFSAKYNEDKEEPRSVNFTIVAGEGTDNVVVSKSVTVIQGADTPFFNVESSDVTFAWDAFKSQDVTIVTNLDYNANAYDAESAGENAFAASWFTITDVKIDFALAGEREVIPAGYRYTFRLTPSTWYNAFNAHNTIQFRYYWRKADGSAEGVSEDVKVTREAAPAASLTLVQKEITAPVGESSHVVEFESAFENVTASVPEDCSWITVSVDNASKTARVKVSGESEESRKADVLFTCGEDNNVATAKLSVEQIGSKPFLSLATNEINCSITGCEETVKLYTNQTPVSVEGSSDWCSVTLNEDKTRLSVIVPAVESLSGARTATFTVKAGTLSETLTIYQAQIYSLGDVYYKGGKPLGFVYSVSDNGEHGKVAAFRVFNDAADEILTADGIKFATKPVDENDGLANMETMKMHKGGYTKYCPVIVAIDKMSEEDGVQWYIPAINELEELVEYCCGQEFTESYEDPVFGTIPRGIIWKKEKWEALGNDGSITLTREEVIPGVHEKAAEMWDVVRGYYRTNTNDEQYVVFVGMEWDEATNTVTKMNDCRQELYEDKVTKTYHGDDFAYRWLSSTANVKDPRYSKMYVYGFFENEVSKASVQIGEDNYEDPGVYAASVHPIMKF